MTSERYLNMRRELEARARWEGISLSDLVTFSEPLRAALAHIIRIGWISLSEFTRLLGLEQEEARYIAEYLVGKNFLRPPTEEDGETIYETRLAVRTRRLGEGKAKDVWDRLGDL